MLSDHEDELEKGSLLNDNEPIEAASNTTFNKERTNRQLNVLYLAVFLDLFAVSIIVPLFSIIYSKLTLDPVTYGFVGTLLHAVALS